MGTLGRFGRLEHHVRRESTAEDAEYAENRLGGYPRKHSHNVCALCALCVLCVMLLSDKGRLR